MIYAKTIIEVMPKCCAECNFLNKEYPDFWKYFCNILNKDIPAGKEETINYIENNKPDWCPLVRSEER